LSPTSFISSLTFVGGPRGPAVAAVDPQRLGDDLVDRDARVQARVRVLEDDLDLAPHAPHLAAGHLGEVVALEVDVPGGGVEQPHDVRPVVDLPQPDSPTRPTVSPALTVKLTPSTAWTAPNWRLNTPARSGKCLTRFSTRSLGPERRAPMQLVLGDRRRGRGGGEVLGAHDAAPSSMVAPVVRSTRWISASISSW
jgi:hypothetical protein